MVKAKGFRIVSTISGIIGTCFMIYNFMSPDTTKKNCWICNNGSKQYVELGKHFG